MMAVEDLVNLQKPVNIEETRWWEGRRKDEVCKSNICWSLAAEGCNADQGLDDARLGLSRIADKGVGACDNKTYASRLDKIVRRDDGLKRNWTSAQCHG